MAAYLKLHGPDWLIMGFDDNFVVIVHLGAGHHSSSKKDLYFKLCQETCDLVINTFLESERNILKAAKKGIQHLEVT